jgi:hypothetical protein
MAMRPYAPSGITLRVLAVGARRRLAPTSSLPTRTLSFDMLESGFEEWPPGN